MIGWNEREVDLEGQMLEDLLRSLVTSDGQSLYELLIENGKLRGGYIISVNGSAVTSLEMPLKSGDRVITMEMVRLFHGG